MWFPFGWDHGIHASVGEAVVQGGMPYRDAWDMKGPLSYFTFAFAQGVFGRNMLAIRLLDLALFVPTLLVFGRLLAAWTSPLAALWGTFGFLRLGRRKLFLDERGQAELYDLRADPGELNDLGQAEPQFVSELTAMLEEWLSTHRMAPPTRASPELSPEDIKRLRSLGYLE